MEKIIKVDLNDNKIGEIEKLDAHKTPVLHRAFSVFLYDGDKLLLQKRAKNKYHSGGLWANSCCSHPRADKTFLQSVFSRLDFELGIKTELDLKELFTFTYLTQFSSNLYEYELDHVLVAQYNSSCKIDFNTSEIAEMKWVTIEDLKKDLENNPLSYASWFLICAPKVIEHLKTINKF